MLSLLLAAIIHDRKSMHCGDPRTEMFGISGFKVSRQRQVVLSADFALSPNCVLSCSFTDKNRHYIVVHNDAGCDEPTNLNIK